MKIVYSAKVDKQGKIKLPLELLRYLESAGTQKIDFYMSRGALILLPEGAGRSDSPLQYFGFPYAGVAVLSESPVDLDKFYDDMPKDPTEK